VVFSEDDVKLVNRWKAHKDAINWITWVPELKAIGSCSYDCNVYLWSRQQKKVGSLVLGNKATMPGQELDPETARYRAGWDICIDKWTRFEEEMEEAEEIWSDVKVLNKNYNNIKQTALEKQRKLKRQNNGDNTKLAQEEAGMK